MHITLTPTRRDETLTLTRAGETLIINSVAFDFSVVPEGATLPREAIDCEWIAGDVTRIGGVLTVPLILPHGANAPEATRFPAPITLTSDGPVELPLYENPQPEPEGAE